MRADARNPYFSAEPARTQPARHRRGPRRCRSAARAGHLRDCGPKLAVFYLGHVSPTIATAQLNLVDGRGCRHMNVGGQAIAAVAEAFLAAAQLSHSACVTTPAAASDSISAVE